MCRGTVTRSRLAVTTGPLSVECALGPIETLSALFRRILRAAVALELRRESRDAPHVHQSLYKKLNQYLINILIRP